MKKISEFETVGTPSFKLLIIGQVKKCTIFYDNFNCMKNIKFFNVAKKFNAEWVDVVNRGSDWRPKKTTVICSFHF